MGDSYTASVSSQSFSLWGQLAQKRIPLSFDIELTPRCNNDCRHCYINLPAADEAARRSELSPAEIERIAAQAVDLGALWCLLTGGEPLLRPDFAEIYLMLKRKGLLVNVFTNACLVSEEHVHLFQKHPPRNLEVSVYGATRETYERVTRKPGSYAAFRRGLDLLQAAGVKAHLKATVLRSNAAELPEIARFCRALTADYYRFDPLLHLRYDGDPRRNAEILSERLSPAEIAAVEQADPERAAVLQEHCGRLIIDEPGQASSRLFHCGAGQGRFSVGYDGTFRLCASLNAPGCTYDLRQGSLAEAWSSLVPRVRALETDSQDFREHCSACPLINLCLWCPANAYFETGQLDGRSAYFCLVAEARAAAIQKSMSER